MVKPLVLLLALALPAGALSVDIPERLMVVGTIGAANPSRHSFIVNDKRYYITETTLIERTDGRTGSATDLVDGQRIGFNFSIRNDGRFYLETVWILPEGATRDR